MDTICDIQQQKPRILRMSGFYSFCSPYFWFFWKCISKLLPPSTLVAPIN
jgi:hypothetical protein